MRVTLRLSEGLDSEQGMLKVIDLGERPFVLGRSPDADWTVHDPSSRVSGTHFELRKSGKDILLVDLSSGGTGLNSAANRLQQGQPTRLPDDCKLVLPVGSVSVSVERDDAGARRLDAREEDDFFRIGEIKRERSGGVSAFPGVNPSELLADPVTTDTLRTRSLILEDEPLPGPAPISDASSESKLMSPGDLLGGGMPAPLAEPRPHPARSAPQLGTDTLSTTRLPEPPVKPAQTAQPVQRGTSWLDDEEEDDPFGGGPIIADEPPEDEPLRPPTTL
ncbi:MAG: FHA domain-containing protein, partial [Paracoccaceae bacterium]